MVPLPAIFFVIISMVTGCTQADRSDVGERIQMADHKVNDPNVLNKAGDPIIFDAIENTDLERVKRLVEAGADIDKQGFGEQTPALVAASTSQWDICLYILEQGADATVADDTGITVPYLAFNANILPTSYQGPYLAKVREFLAQRNLSALNIPPKRVRQLQSSGAWPPEAMRAK